MMPSPPARMAQARENEQQIKRQMRAAALAGLAPKD
jgi:hypothetical protein